MSPQVQRTCECGATITLPYAEGERELAERLAGLIVCAACAERDRTEEHARRHERELKSRLTRARLPMLYQRRLAELDPRAGQAEAILAANGWAQEGGLLFLHGDVGRGKTTLAAAALRERLEHAEGRWITGQQLLAFLRADFHSADYEHMQKLIAPRHALVIDDFGRGAHEPSEYVRNMLQLAIDGRYAHGVPVLITSNELASDLGRTYGRWLASRLAGDFRQIHVGGLDHRLQPEGRAP